MNTIQSSMEHERSGMTVLILGARGMLGTDLINVFSRVPSMRTVGMDMPEIDITNADMVSKVMHDLEPAVVINAAAFTNVDGCEDAQYRDVCMRVNGEAVGILARATAESGATLLGISTDYVFDGSKKEGYREDDIPLQPINRYGESKLLGEKAITENPHHYLVRTSWLYGIAGKSFPRTMVELARTKKELAVVNDQFGKPTYTRDLAEALLALIQKKLPYGTYHLVNEGATSWYEFAEEIFRLAHLPVTVRPVSSGAFPRSAHRPQYSALINTKAPHLRDWHEALQDFFREREHSSLAAKS